MSFLEKIMAFVKGEKPAENKVNYVQGEEKERSVFEKDAEISSESEASAKEPEVSKEEPETSTEESAAPKPEEDSIVGEKPAPEEPQGAPVPEEEPVKEEIATTETQKEAEDTETVEEVLTPEKETSQGSAEGSTEKPATSVEELEKKMKGPVPEIKAEEGGPAESDKPES